MICTRSAKRYLTEISFEDNAIKICIIKSEHSLTWEGREGEKGRGKREGEGKERREKKGVRPVHFSGASSAYLYYKSS